MIIIVAINTQFVIKKKNYTNILWLLQYNNKNNRQG